MRVNKILALLIGILAFAAPRICAQEIDAPDYKQIRSQISNSKLPSYYPRLMERYVQSDSTLSLEDYRNLYYGFTLREDFVPYQMEKQTLFDARRKIVETHGDPSVCPEAIKVAQAVLDDNPFDIPAIAVISIAYLQLGDTLSYHLWDIKQQGLLDAISSSGDGETARTAFHVISVEHEYEVLNRLGLELEKDSLIGNNVEYLRVKENAENIEGIYFNFDACANIYRKKYK
ncbi:MAG: DUF4919 domain-containing protein [Bacteroidales bacterium]|nr:DUF4919 domain-containing protein [Candidatus Liminaster caballi]